MVCKISPVNNSGILTNQDSYPYWKSETRIWNVAGTGYVDRSGAKFCERWEDIGNFIVS